jgi:hypothetical protein
MEKSDLMRTLMERLFRKKHQPEKSSIENQEKSESEDHIFKSNQSFRVVKKKIVRRRD